MTSSKPTPQGACPDCKTLQLLHLEGDPDITEEKAENFRVGYHASAQGVACNGFNKPPTSLYFPQGASGLKPEDMDDDLSEINRDGDYRSLHDDSDWPEPDRIST
jgi:hypothetical protein